MESHGGFGRHSPARVVFHLTRDERIALAVILGLFLLGAGTRWLLLSRENPGNPAKIEPVSGG